MSKSGNLGASPSSTKKALPITTSTPDKRRLPPTRKSSSSSLTKASASTTRPALPIPAPMTKTSKNSSFSKETIHRNPDQIHGLSTGVVFQAGTPSGNFLCIYRFSKKHHSRRQKPRILVLYLPDRFFLVLTPFMYPYMYILVFLSKSTPPLIYRELLKKEGVSTDTTSFYSVNL